MLNDKERSLLRRIRDDLQSDGTDEGDAVVRVQSRQITEMFGEDFSNYRLLMEKPPYAPLYFPENYPENYAVADTQSDNITRDR